jgi:altronate dehydratase small subunit
MKIDAILLNPEDNVATALDDLTAGREVAISVDNDSLHLTIKEEISFGHKFAVEDLEQGVPVIKYGEIIGRTTRPIPKGFHAHVHNIESLRGRGDLE